MVAPVQDACAASRVIKQQSNVRASALQPHLKGPIQLVASLGTITSIVRSVEHNRRVGGVPNSYHLAGFAFDVRRNAGVTHKALDAALRRAGYSPHESLDEIDHSHFAFLPGPSVKDLNQLTPPVAPPQKAATPVLAADDHGVLLLEVGELLSTGGRR